MLPSDPGTRHIPVADAGDWYGPDEHLAWLVRRLVGEAAWPVAGAALEDLGRLVPTVVEPLAVTADRHPPVLHQYDRRGARVDEIEFHPSYVELEAVVTSFGLVRAAHVPGWRGLRGTAPSALVAAMNYLVMQADLSVTGCPIGMMDAGARCLTRNDPALAARFVPRIAADDGSHMTVAMLLTEKAGGSDVGANETVAAPAADGTWRLTGEKWFASCPHSDLLLVTARPEGGAPGTRGLGLFLVPRHLDGGGRNAVLVHRLKDKLGTRAMASGEVGLRDAFAWQVGALDRGMAQMLDMVNATRIGIAATAAAIMRRSAFESLEHARGRTTFGAALDTHPLMRDTLAELVVDATAGLSAALWVADAAERAEHGDRAAADVVRLLTPLFKGHGVERARVCATEAMEVRGGNGAIEEWPSSRILRDACIHAIWEGPGNIMALDVLRAIRRGAAPALLADVEARAEAASVDGPAACLGTALLSQLRSLEDDIASAAALDAATTELRARRLARRLAVTAMAARLAEEARDHAAETGSGRLAWIAARYTARLGGEPALDAVAGDAAWLEHAGPILRGGHVPLEVAEAAARLVAGRLGAPAPAGVAPHGAM
ncbi:MAG TPA: acyl-CoA dehydrogenase family protein [Candidatus Dormibacteraeota bacterium]|nr:acyl-CoA dehydrogenase family protein [Candidatus Dormibacteraeota bacterium]